jgi:hypothetical protein
MFCGFVGTYQYSRGIYCLHLQGSIFLQNIDVYKNPHDIVTQKTNSDTKTYKILQTAFVDETLIYMKHLTFFPFKDSKLSIEGGCMLQWSIDTAEMSAA